MDAGQRRRVGRWAMAQAAAGVIVLGSVSLLIDRQVSARDARNAASDPNAAAVRQIESGVEVVLIGNSLLHRGVNENELGRRFADRGLRQALLWEAGSGAALWYLQVRNVVCAAPRPPRVAVVCFLGDEVRNPAVRAVGGKWEGLRRYTRGAEPEFLRRLSLAQWREGRPTDVALTALHAVWPAYAAKHGLSDDLFRVLTAAPGDALRAWQPEANWPSFARANERRSPRLRAGESADQPADEPGKAYAMHPERFDFDRMLDESLLPGMVEACRERGVRLAFVRMKPNPDGPMAVLSNEPMAVRYFSQLSNWCAAQGVDWLDLSQDPEITRACFHVDDHMNRNGRAILTPKLADWAAGLASSTGMARQIGRPIL